jgi:hypothetical protein
MTFSNLFRPIHHLFSTFSPLEKQVYRFARMLLQQFGRENQEETHIWKKQAHVVIVA